MTSPASQRTDFTLDIMGRYMCNGLDEARASMDPSKRSDARPFDVIVIGGGSFGPIVAQQIFTRDTTHSHRVLVLEGGPFVVPEHVQNLPLLGLKVPGATSIQELRNQGNFGPDKPREEMWGLSWHSPTRFTGLAFCLGGRSLFFGGWSPPLLDSEMPVNRWPQSVVDDLNQTYFDDASQEIGTNETNDFIHGPLHDTLRQLLRDGIKAGDVAEAAPFNELPLLYDNIKPGEEDLWKLEAPLAVQSQTAPGFFPFNKFSSVPLLMKTARAAWAESNNDDVNRRLMIVPNCHVTRLRTEDAVINGRLTKRVAFVDTAQGSIEVPPYGIVIIALGTIESARLALLSFGDTPHANLIGRNLMAHLRSNLTIRIPRTSLPNHQGLPKALMASALFVKGKHRFSDGNIGHFHLQITAAGLDEMGTDSEAELFKKIPDIDTFDRFRNADDKSVVITIRGIGEMQPDNPDSFVRLDPEADEFGAARGFVSLGNPANSTTPQSRKDLDLWEALDNASDEVAKVFANGKDLEVFTPQGAVRVASNMRLRDVLPHAPGRRDGMGTTHHESGTLWMGTNPNQSVTDADGRFHEVANAYVAGPALFPTIGSPNPMLTGVALARRLAKRLIADRLLPTPAPFQADAGFQVLFDGTERSFNKWQTAGQGVFSLVDGEIVAHPGGDLGLLYYAAERFGDFTLRLEFLLDRLDNNSGVFVRFRNPRLPVPDRNNPGVSYPYQNQAYVAVDTGFEIQIDEQARGTPPGLDEHRTAAIYGIPLGSNDGQQAYLRGPALQTGNWNRLEIEVKRNTYTVQLNNQQTTTFTNIDTYRGKSADDDLHSGYIGLQAHTGLVRFRNIQIQAARPVPPRRRTELEEVTVASTSPPSVPGAEREEEPVTAEAKLKAKKATAAARKRSA